MRKKIDETAGRFGHAMRTARQACHMSSDDAARLLRMMPNELLEYERGVTKVPIQVFEYFCILGYKMMRVRVAENVYLRRQAVFRKMREIINSAPK